MKSKYLFRVMSLLALFVSFLPSRNASALISTALPPADMFQLPWGEGLAWVAIDGIDNGSKRPASSSHNYKLGGAIDFAPHNNMITGENTSNFWVTAAAAGTVIQTASCYVTIAHDNGWITQYQFLGNIQVKLGDAVARNQRLAVIADGVRQKYCPGFQEINVPHLHFILRPSIIGATFAGWEVKYSSLFNSTTFTKNGSTVGLFKPLLNTLDSQTTPTPTITPSVTPSPTPTGGTAQPGSVLALSKTANPQTYEQVGQIITYNFTITNTGATPLGPAQFVVTDNKLAAPLPCGPADATIATNQTLSCVATYNITQGDMSVASLTNIATASGAGQTSAPASATITNLVGPASPTPTPSSPYVSTTVTPPDIHVGLTALATVGLNNVPAGGHKSAEFTCTYNASLVEVSNITVTNLFGADPVAAINGPQNGSFIVAIAGSDGHKATTSGAAFTFNVKGLQAGQTTVDCDSRVSEGNNVLTDIPSAAANVTVSGGTLTPTTPAPGTPTVPPSLCDRAEFIADITVPNGTVFAPGTTFTKTWRLKNLGPCTWTTAYQIVFFSGDQMSAVSSASFPNNVAVGETVDLSINMTAPSTAGSYRGYWMFKNANGTLFGAGPQANEPWFVDIMVSSPSSATPGGPGNSPTPTVSPGAPSDTPTPPLPETNIAYDFATNACTAVWYSGAGQLPCPGVDGDAKGFVLKLSNPRLETGATDTQPGLLTFPQNVSSGYIQGFYPQFRVQNGDRFRAILNCEFGATLCYVGFRLDYQVGNESIKTLWGPFLERYEGKYYSADVDLSSLAGKDVKFILTTLSAGVATGDRALWGRPIIYRASTGSTHTPTPTSTSPAGAWLTFTNPRYNLQFKYPQEGQIVSGSTDNYARITLPFTTGTNLSEKYLEVIVAENANLCRSPRADGTIPATSETVIINGISFLKETGEDGTAGHINKWTAYSTRRDNVCVSLDFVLRAANPDVFPTPPPIYDEAAESAVFAQIVSTYAWLSSATATPTPTSTSAPGSSPTPTGSPSPTSTPGTSGILTGQVLASQPVTVSLYDAVNTLVTSVAVNTDGTFSLTAPAGAYKVSATAGGFLGTQGSVTLTAGNTNTLPAISLLAGDIDGNSVIDQFDALTIGMSYNTTVPTAANLNNDEVINVLDLELLAGNYRKTGPVAWQ